MLVLGTRTAIYFNAQTNDWFGEQILNTILQQLVPKHTRCNYVENSITTPYFLIRKSYFVAFTKAKSHIREWQCLFLFGAYDSWSYFD